MKIKEKKKVAIKSTQELPVHTYLPHAQFTFVSHLFSGVLCGDAANGNF